MKLIIEIDKDLYESIAGKNTDQVEPRQVVRSFQATIADAIANGIPYNPSGDAISRRVIKNLLGDKSIPIKFEKEKRRDWHRSLGMTLGDIYTVIDNAPSVELERPQGKWIDHTATQNLLWGHLECPFCHKRSNRGASYCQYCGARLEEAEENA